MSTVLHKILEAREHRASVRTNYSKDGLLTLSLSLNIPGYPKHNRSSSSIFDLIVEELKIFISSHRIQLEDKQELKLLDEAGHFYIVAIQASNYTKLEIKAICETFEHSFELGRITDVDLFDENAKPVSSGKKKACIICETKAAVDCMRSGAHKHSEVRALMFEQMERYALKERQKKVTQSLTESANKALIYEFSLSPKPGLVDALDSGSHADMNYYSFVNSTSAISSYWQDFSNLGWEYEQNLSEALPLIRQIGIKAEQSMFYATENANTQKGLIFLLGTSVFAASYTIKREGQFVESVFIENLKTIGKDLVDNELQQSGNKAITHGEQTFRKYGVAGARYELENAFPIVFIKILPFLEKELKQDSFLDKTLTDRVLIKALLMIMSDLNDSNILYRKGAQKLEIIKQMAAKSIDSKPDYNALCRYCESENISPGGSADILAISLFSFFLKQNDKII